jgi:nucleotide-binding universal stress UspA family protein/nitrite reductase/ring-hydroxylating ferredoxin subunit
VGYRRILAGTDGSETATASVRTAARLAKRFRSELMIVSAYEPPKFTAQQSQAALDSATEAAREEGVEPQTEILLGQIGDVLLDRARRRGVELIVIGNRGIGPAKRIGLGSLADRVAHDAPCDLLIVNTAGPGRRSDELYRSMLVGTDGSATAGEAVRKAYELAMVLRAEVHLAHVGDPLLGAITLEEAEGAKLGRTQVTRHGLQGDPAEQLLEVAEQQHIGLILVGNKGMAGAKRLLGSVPNAIAHRAPCDVLIARTVGRSVDDLAPGTGGLVDMAGARVAAYKDEAGGLHALNPRCTHMGCTVDWNEADRTWDCPCHGSRYSVDGAVLEGPATRPLPPA